jgi:hypothetical protein
MDPSPLIGVVRPPVASTNAMIQYLETELDRNAKTYVPPIGPHRLNRTEYGNAIRDLLDLEIDATKLLPTDDSTHYFDNIVSALGNSPKAIEPYIGIAPIVSRMAIQTATNSPSYQKVFLCQMPPRFSNGNPEPCSRKVIGALTDNAYRGMVTSVDIDSLMSIVKAGGGISYGFYSEGFVPALAQILASPKFLYRTEDGHYQFKYLPIFACAMAPFAWFSEDDAKTIWYTLSCMAGLMLVYESIRLLPERRLPSSGLFWLTLCCMAKFYGRELALGQF